MALLDSMVRDAEKSGDLVLSELQSVESVNFCNWAMSFGTLSLMMHAEDAQVIKKLTLKETLLHNICITLDGLGWKPLSSEWDYQATIQRIQEEIFAPEMELLKQQS